MGRQPMRGLALRTVIRPITIRVSNLFGVLLDGPSEGVYNAVCIVMQCGQPNNR